MLVAAWGYGIEAEKLGGYPNGYMEIAHKYGVLDTVSFNYGNASKRWVASMFVYGVLESLPVSEASDKKLSPPAIPKSESSDGEKADGAYESNGDAVIIPNGDTAIIPKSEAPSSKKEPLSEYSDGFPADTVAILSKVTPASAKYEEKAFITTHVEAEKAPFGADGENLVYFADIGSKSVSFSIHDPTAKERGKTTTEVAALRVGETARELNLSELPEGEWEFSCVIIMNAVKDSYIGSIVKSKGQLAFKGLSRAVTLNAQPRVTETVKEVKLSNAEKAVAGLFSVWAAAGKDGEAVLYMNYDSVVNSDAYLSYTINEHEPPLITNLSERFNGKNEKIGAIAINGLRFNVPYFLQLAASDIYGSGTSLRGEITFANSNGEAYFDFDGLFWTLHVDGYEITDYV